MTIVTIHKMDENLNEKWFFSTNHCQPGLDNNWVPITHYHTTPEQVRERNNFCSVIGGTTTEIKNPNPFFRPEYSV